MEQWINYALGAANKLSAIICSFPVLLCSSALGSLYFLMNGELSLGTFFWYINTNILRALFVLRFTSGFLSYRGAVFSDVFPCLLESMTELFIEEQKPCK